MNNFPTGKPHISFSEIKQWKECPWRHKLLYIDKIDLFEPSPHLDYGTSVHNACESYLKTGQMITESAEIEIREAFEKNGKTWYEQGHPHVDTWVDWAKVSLDALPAYFDEMFGDWQAVEAEEYLYEEIEGKEIKFKGFIDSIIKTKNKKGKEIYWILDYKTAPKYGWRREKKQSILMTAQLILYKHFWARKHSVALEDIRCGFILMKRGSKPEKSCELVAVSVGPKTLERGIKMMNNMIYSVKTRMFLKNRDSCKWCQYKNTNHCT